MLVPREPNQLPRARDRDSRSDLDSMRLPAPKILTRDLDERLFRQCPRQSIGERFPRDEEEGYRCCWTTRSLGATSPPPEAHLHTFLFSGDTRWRDNIGIERETILFRSLLLPKGSKRERAILEDS